MDFRYFPYDNQLCELKFGSWLNNDQELNLTEVEAQTVDVVKLNPARDVKLTKLTATRFAEHFSCCPERYPEMIFTFHLERVSSAYSVKLVLPAVISGFLVLASFLLPAASHEKIALCGLLFLCLVLQLTYLHDFVPTSGETMLGDFLAFALFIDGFAIVLAVISYHVYIRSSASTKSDSIALGEEGVSRKNNYVSKSVPDQVLYCMSIKFCLKVSGSLPSQILWNE